VIHEDRIDLSPSVCRTLARVRRGHASLREEAGAISVLAHESQHMVGADGIEDEAKTECYGMQRLAHAARLLGVSPAAAKRLPVVYFRVGYPELPASYRTKECRDGGKLDLHPDDSRFP